MSIFILPCVVGWLFKRFNARRGAGGGGIRNPRRLGKRETIPRLYLSLHCHHENDSCIRVGSDESHFNV